MGHLDHQGAWEAKLRTTTFIRLVVFFLASGGALTSRANAESYCVPTNDIGQPCLAEASQAPAKGFPECMSLKVSNICNRELYVVAIEKNGNQVGTTISPKKRSQEVAYCKQSECGGYVDVKVLCPSSEDDKKADKSGKGKKKTADASGEQSAKANSSGSLKGAVKEHFKKHKGSLSPHESVMSSCGQSESCEDYFDQYFGSSAINISENDRQEQISNCLVRQKYTNKYCERANAGASYAYLFDIYKYIKKASDAEDAFLKKVADAEAEQSEIASKEAPAPAAKQRTVSRTSGGPRQKLAEFCRENMSAKNQYWACCPDSRDRGGADDMSGDEACLAQFR